MPRAHVETTRVTRVYPSSSTVPENLLRFYVYFSSPMGEGDALEHLSLLDESGREVRGVFFDNFYELWDPTRRRPDISRAKELLGWEPEVSRGEGLRKTLEYFKRELAGL